jgi:hypothetical protein
LIELPKPCETSNYDPSSLEIEPDWNRFVGETYSQSLPSKVAKQQMAIWELIATECSHIKTTKIIIDIFLNCLTSLKACDLTTELFSDIDINKLFCNIADVFNCNLNFWQKYLQPIVEDLRTSSDKQIDPFRLIEGFSDVIYIKFCFCIEKNFLKFIYF